MAGSLQTEGRSRAGAEGVTDHGIDPHVHQRRWWTLGVLCLSLLIIMVGNTSLNVALPRLSATRVQGGLGASNSQLQWMVDAYSLVFAGLLFTAGNLGDRYGRKGILQGGLALFAAGTAYAAFVAHSAGQVIAARVVMGAAAAMVMPATLSILTNVFPREERAKAVATWAGVSGAGAAIGPLLSGFVLERFSWNAVFTINLPVIALAALAGVVLVPRSRGEHDASLDLPGALLSAVGLSAVVYTIIEAPSKGWLSTETLVAGAIGAAVMALFVAWELRTESPMLDVRLFRVGAFGISSVALTLVFFALMGSFFSMTQLLQLVYGYSPLGASVRLAPISLAIMIAAPRSAGLAARFGKRRVVAAGMWTVAAGIGSLLLIGERANYPLLLGGLFVMALGMGLSMSPTTDLLMSAVPRDKAGMGSAMNDTTRELGGSLGVAVFGSLLASRYASQLAPALASLPAQAASKARESLAGAMGVAPAGAPGRAVMAAARTAWLSGFKLSLAVATGVIALAGVVSWRFLPDTAADLAAVPEDGHLEAADLVLDGLHLGDDLEPVGADA